MDKLPFRTSCDDLNQIFARCEGAYAENTLRGYRKELEQFRRWCGERGESWLPAKPSAIAGFIDDQARDKAIATIRHRLGAIRFAHRLADLADPSEASVVRLALRRARRSRPARPGQVLGLTRELLDRMVSACPETLPGKRDAALLSVGYDILCRCSELVALQVEDLSCDLARVRIPRSKADPFGKGRLAYLSGLTRGRVRCWLAKSGLDSGPLFRGIHTGKVSEGAMVSSSVRRLVKVAAKRAGLEPGTVARLSAHSMRVGAAQDMLVAGCDTLGIMQSGGWKSTAVLARYVEHASMGQVHSERWKRLSQVSHYPNPFA